MLDIVRDGHVFAFKGQVDQFHHRVGGEDVSNICCFGDGVRILVYRVEHRTQVVWCIVLYAVRWSGSEQGVVSSSSTNIR